jgi:hypothetical protein
VVGVLFAASEREKSLHSPPFILIRGNGGLSRSKREKTSLKVDQEKVDFMAMTSRSSTTTYNNRVKGSSPEIPAQEVEQSNELQIPLPEPTAETLLPTAPTHYFTDSARLSDELAIYNSRGFELYIKDNVTSGKYDELNFSSELLRRDIGVYSASTPDEALDWRYSADRDLPNEYRKNTMIEIPTLGVESKLINDNTASIRVYDYLLKDKTLVGEWNIPTYANGLLETFTKEDVEKITEAVKTALAERAPEYQSLLENLEQPPNTPSPTVSISQEHRLTPDQINPILENYDLTVTAIDSNQDVDRVVGLAQFNIAKHPLQFDVHKSNLKKSDYASLEIN